MADRTITAYGTLEDAATLLRSAGRLEGLLLKMPKDTLFDACRPEVALAVALMRAYGQALEAKAAGRPPQP